MARHQYQEIIDWRASKAARKAESIAAFNQHHHCDNPVTRAYKRDKNAAQWLYRMSNNRHMTAVRFFTFEQIRIRLKQMYNARQVHDLMYSRVSVVHNVRRNLRQLRESRFDNGLPWHNSEGFWFDPRTLFVPFDEEVTFARAASHKFSPVSLMLTVKDCRLLKRKEIQKPHNGYWSISEWDDPGRDDAKAEIVFYFSNEDDIIEFKLRYGK
jgi:hypothetical protein